MKVSELFENLNNYEIIGENKEVEFVVSNYEELVYVKKASIAAIYILKEYIYLDGKYIDKTEKEILNELKEVIKLEPEAIVLSNGLKEKINKKLKDNITYIFVNNINIAEAAISTTYFSNPSLGMKIIGITGSTNRRQVAEMVKTTFDKLGIKTALLSESDSFIEEFKEETDCFEGSLEFQKYLSKLKNMNIEVLILDIMPVVLKYDILLGIKYDIAAFTNLNREEKYLKNFKDIEEYLNTVKKIFAFADNKIIYNDDPAAYYLKQELDQYKTFGTVNKSDYVAVNEFGSVFTTSFSIYLDKAWYRVKVSIPGKEGVLAALAAIAILRASNVDVKKIIEAISDAKVKGDFEVLLNEYEIHVVYHNLKRDDLDEVDWIVKRAKALVSGRMVCVLSRDGLDLYEKYSDFSKIEKDKNDKKENPKAYFKKNKNNREKKYYDLLDISDEDKKEIQKEKKYRKELATVVGRTAEIIILTTGSSNFESEKNIITEMRDGINKTKTRYFEIYNRRRALEKSVQNCQQRDMILILNAGSSEKINKFGEIKELNERQIILDALDKVKPETNAEAIADLKEMMKNITKDKNINTENKNNNDNKDN